MDGPSQNPPDGGHYLSAACFTLYIVGSSTAVEACRLADANCWEIKIGAARFYYDVEFTVFFLF